MEEKYVKMGELLPLIQEKIKNNGQVIFTPFGHSMLPLLKDGKDTVILTKLNRKLKKNDLPLYQRNDGQVVLHRVLKVYKNGEFNTRGDNQIVSEKKVKQEQIIAIVTCLIKNQKEYSIEDKKYSFYCWFWDFIFPLRWLIKKANRLLRKIFKPKKISK